MRRTIVEAGLIVFVLYGILLMREFEHAGPRQSRGFIWAAGGIFTAPNFAIAVMAAVIGYVLVEFLQNKL